jgi:4'-phosphopantetheinyl transferase
MRRSIDIEPPTDDEVHVWVADLDRLPHAASTTVLSDDEHARAARYRFIRDRDRFVTRRAVLRRLLGGYVSGDPAALRFSTTAQGKPRLTYPATRLQFSTTHSGGVAVVAVSCEHVVGVDAEWIRPDAVTDLTPRVCTRAERDRLDAMPAHARPTAFFTLWAHKEALVKADGRGLSLPVGDIDVARALEDGTVRTRLQAQDGSILYTSRSLAVRSGMATAVARPTPTFTLQRREVDVRAD